MHFLCLVSSAPENVTVSLVTNSTIALHWLKPSQPNGLIAGYRENPENKKYHSNLNFSCVLSFGCGKKGCDMETTQSQGGEGVSDR